MKTETTTQPAAAPPLPAPSGSVYYPLFEHMAANHGLTMLDSEMEEICRVVRRMDQVSRAGNMVAPKCARCGVTISRVTYGRHGPHPLTVWKHVGNQWQRTDCKQPTPPNSMSRPKSAG